MGILSDTIKIIVNDLETEDFELSIETNTKTLDYVDKKSTNRKEGIEIIREIIREIFLTKQKEIELLKLANNTNNNVVEGIEKLKAILKSEEKPFQRDKAKYFVRYWIFLVLTIITILFLLILFLLPIFKADLLSNDSTSQITYRVSLFIPFSSLIALFIHQYINALKHYHKACESIHIMGSYPIIINAICLNEKQKEKASVRLFDMLFDWQPRPTGWKINNIKRLQKKLKKRKKK